MAIYVYKCKTCENYFEFQQPMTAEPVTECPLEECDGKIHRVPQPAGVHYKGGGWGGSSDWRYPRAKGSPPIHGT